MAKSKEQKDAEKAAKAQKAAEAKAAADAKAKADSEAGQGQPPENKPEEKKPDVKPPEAPKAPEKKEPVKMVAKKGFCFVKSKVNMYPQNAPEFALEIGQVKELPQDVVDELLADERGLVELV